MAYTGTVKISGPGTFSVKNNAGQTIYTDRSSVAFDNYPTPITITCTEKVRGATNISNVQHTGDYTFQITGNVIIDVTAYTAAWTVRFLDGSTVLKTQTVLNGLSATAPSNPTKKGYSFSSWDTSFKNVTSNLDVYAQWTVNTYTVTLDQQSGSGGTTSVNVTYGSAMPTITTPTRTGYVFGGYYTGTNGTGTQYYTAEGTSANNWNLASDSTLYAKWNPVVTFNANGGSITYSPYSNPQTFNYGDTLDFTQIYRSRTGYGFVGWWTDAVGGTKYDDTVTVTDSFTAHAHWNASTYYLSLDKQGGSGGPDGIAVTYDSAMPTILTLPTRTGYTFNGYYTNTGSSGTKYYNANGTSARKWDIAETSILYAGWTKKSTTVTFGKNGGTGGTDSVTAEYDSAMPSATAPSRTGYDFDGYWDTTKAGGKKYYAADMTSARSWDKDVASTTLWAKWEPHSYAVKFFKNDVGATGAMVDQQFDYGETKSLTPNGFSLRGHTFNGWNTQSDGTGTAYANGASVKSLTAEDGGTVALYAQWTPINYGVTLDMQSGSGGSSRIDVTYGKPMPAATMPTRAGYTFGGYYTQQNGGGTQYYTASGSSARNWDETDVTRLYAKWTPNMYKVTFGKNGGTGGDDYVTATYGQPMPTPRTAPTRAGYTFGGYWDTTGTGGKQYYNADMTSARNWDRASVSTLYAKWTPNTYKVYFGKNGGTGGDDYVTVTYDAAMPTPRTAPTRAGYVFDGYWDTVGENGKQYYNAQMASVRNWDKVVAAEEFFIWAKWKAVVRIDMVAICGDTDEAGSIPAVAGRPKVWIGVQSGEVSVSGEAVQDDAVVVQASGRVDGMQIGRIIVTDGTGTLADVIPTVQHDIARASFVTRTTNIRVRAVYSRNPVSVSVAKGDASSALDAQTSISPVQETYRFGDGVDFVAADSANNGAYPFYGWSASSATPASTSDVVSGATTHHATLTGDTVFYAHYAQTVGVSKRAIDKDGVATEDEGGSVKVYVLGTERVVGRTSPVSNLRVPFGSTLRILSTAQGEYLFLGIKYKASASADTGEDTGYGSDETFEPKGNGVYEVTFQKEPPFVYLACADVAEPNATGTKGQTIATCADASAFIPVPDDVPDFAEGVPSNARWYKVRAGTAVTLSASRASDADALSWKKVEYGNLTRVVVSEGADGETIEESIALQYGTGDAEPSGEVWRERSYTVVGDMKVVTTWGAYLHPSVTLDARRGGGASFKGEQPSVRQKDFDPTYDSQTGLYTYQTATVVAEPSDGYAFVGWYSKNLSQIVATSTEYSFEVRQDETLEAVFRADDDAVFVWEGGTRNKSVEWRSGVITVPRPADPVAARVDATGYPVELDVGTYSSPDAEPPQGQHAVSMTAQAGRRLPRLRPERFWRLSVRADVEIDAIAVATNVVEVN